MRKKYYFLMSCVTVLLVYFCMYMFPCDVAEAYAQMAGTIFYKNKTYYVTVDVRGNKATVWLCTNQYMSTPSDIKIMEVNAENAINMGNTASRLICGAKYVYNQGKKVVGCGATVASGVCIAGAVPSGGATVAVCHTVFVYTADKGLADCVRGTIGGIAKLLGKSQEWNVIRLAAGLSIADWTEAASSSLDMACTALKK